MFGLELLMAGVVSMPVTEVRNSAINCVPKVAPVVNVIPSKSRVKYDFSKSRQALKNFDIDTISPYGPEHQTHVGGLMAGSIQVERSIGFMHETYETVGEGCVHIKTIDVKIHIDPTIYVASEYGKGSCHFDEILIHEKKHVREDQLVVNKYAQKIGKALAKVMDDNGPVFGPYKIEELSAIQTNIETTLNDVVSSFNDEMNEERTKRQQAIDSREEYDSIAKKCNGFH